MGLAGEGEGGGGGHPLQAARIMRRAVIPSRIAAPDVRLEEHRVGSQPGCRLDSMIIERTRREV